MRQRSVVEVDGVRVESSTRAPVLILKEKDGVRFLPIWISHFDASLIVQTLDPDEPEPISIHRLVADRCQQMSLHITSYSAGIFEGEIHCRDSVWPSRISDIAVVSLLTQCPIEVEASVMDEAAVDLWGIDSDEVEDFKRFIDGVTASQFDI